MIHINGKVQLHTVFNSFLLWLKYLVLTFNFHGCSLQFQFVLYESDKWQQSPGWMLLVVKIVFHAACVSFLNVSELFKLKSCCESFHSGRVVFSTSGGSGLGFASLLRLKSVCLGGRSSWWFWSPAVAAYPRMFTGLALPLTQQTHCHPNMGKSEVDTD